VRAGGLGIFGAIVVVIVIVWLVGAL